MYILFPRRWGNLFLKRKKVTEIEKVWVRNSYCFLLMLFILIYIFILFFFLLWVSIHFNFHSWTCSFSHAIKHFRQKFKLKKEKKKKENGKETKISFDFQFHILLWSKLIRYSFIGFSLSLLFLYYILCWPIVCFVSIFLSLCIQKKNH